MKEMKEMKEPRFKELKRKSNLSGKLHRYLLIDELPTNFRSYDVKEVYVRGLFFEESENLAKFVGNTRTEDVSYKILKNIYSDVIQGIDIGELEIPDFQILMIISSIWTVRGFGWTPNIPCPQLVKNERIDKLKEEIEDLKNRNQEEEIEDFDSKLKNLMDDLAIQPEMVKCSGIINRKIVLDDLETYDTEDLDLPIEISINDEPIKVGPLTVDDFIVIEENRNNANFPNKTFLSYAMMIKNDMTLQEKYDTIRYNEQADIAKIKELDDKLFIKLKPVIKQCPKCLKTCKVYIGLDKLKAFP